MSALTSAWQAALAAEHQACFGYGLLGPKLKGAELALARQFFTAHERIRDSTQAAIAAAGLAPVPPEPDYPALYPVTDGGVARRRALTVEQTCASAWRYLYAEAALRTDSSAPELRTAAQAGLTASAVRAARWRALLDPERATVPFPGT